MAQGVGTEDAQKMLKKIRSGGSLQRYFRNKSGAGLAIIIRKLSKENL